MRRVGWLVLVVGLGCGQAQGQGLSAESRWIAAGGDGVGLPVFRREFVVARPVREATLVISGLGEYEAHVNGKNVTDAVLRPGWTDYKKRVPYDSYDVTSLVKQGRNAVGVMLGNGMYNVEQTKGRYTKFVGSFGELKLVAELRVTYKDGGELVVRSGEGWRSAAGPVVFSSIYGGEDYDARLEQAGWDEAGFEEGNWKAVKVVEGPGGVLERERIPAVKGFERFDAVKVTQPKAGVTVYDLGQNFAGWPDIEVQGERGAVVKMVAGELLDKDGLVTQRSANANPQRENSFQYVLRGGGVEVWHPRFSYYGFRYVQVEEQEGPKARLLRMGGRFVHDDARLVGKFVSSDELMNRIHGLIDRAMLSNMVSVLTDCPTREKLGWLEQTHLAGTALMENYDLVELYRKITLDMVDAQTESGLVPDIAPEYVTFSGGFRDSPEWGSAVVLSPWIAYQFSGDVGLLREGYGAMNRYAAYLKGMKKDGVLAYGLGDWYDVGPKAPGQSQLTGKGVTATATYYELLVELEQIAGLLGDAKGAAEDKAEREAVRAAFNAKYFNAETDVYDTGSQTAEAMPLVVGLVPEGHELGVLGKLVADVQVHGGHVTAGDVGFHYVVRALTDGDRSDVVYEMLSKTDRPSYGDQLVNGATALTEAWDTDPKSSQNHFMLGHAEEWFYRGLAGIDFDMSRLGAERIRIHPAVVGEMKSAGASLASQLGEIESGWVREKDRVVLTLVVPEAASLTLPVGYGRLVKVNGKAALPGVRVPGVRVVGAGRLVVKAGGYRMELGR